MLARSRIGNGAGLVREGWLAVLEQAYPREGDIWSTFRLDATRTPNFAACGPGDNPKTGLFVCILQI
jgi:hypothetical protein